MKKILAFAVFAFSSTLSLQATAGGNIAAGKALAEKYSCAACHGTSYTNPIDPVYPILAGQHADYLQNALSAYKRGDGKNGRANAIMGGQAKPLSTQEIKDIAAYLHSLPGPLVVRR